MATYEEIYGKRVKEFDSDPTLESSYEGQVWYDKSTGVLKSVVAFESTSSTSPMNTARVQGAGGGIQTDGFGAGGYTTTNVATTEEYNGTGFSAGGDLGSARRAMGGTGQTPAGLVFGGYTTTHVGLTEEYNGTSWSESGDLSTTRYALSSANSAPQTAALGFGGYAATKSNATEEYNGTSWTAGGNLNVATHDAAGAGTQTAGLLCGGSAPSVASNITELYDGSSWTSSGTLNLGRQLNMAFGTQTAAVTIGGNKTFSPDTTTDTIETFNGSTWSTSPATLATNRGQAFGIGAPTAGIVFGGKSPGPNLSIAEEYNNSINTFTAAAWASGGNMSQNRYGGASGGTPTAAWYATGYINPGYSNATEEYNGSSWTAGGNITGTNTQSTGSCGTLTAGSRFSGTPPVGPSGTPRVQHEQYDGTSWTNNPATLQQATAGTSGSGTQDACLYTRGRPTTYNEEYNGTAWSAANTISTTNRSGTNSGTQTAGLFLGGEQPPGPYLSLVDEYDGTNWTAGGSLVIPQGGSLNSGTQTDTMAASGYTTDSPWGPSAIEECQIYDGTAFATTASLSSEKSSGGSSNRGNGPSGSNGALVFAGSPAPTSVATEEFTAVTETATASTLTTS